MYVNISIIGCPEKEDIAKGAEKLIIARNIPN